MSDLISRSALLDRYDRIHVGAPGAARKLIEEAPAVDAVPVVHGRWISVDGESECDEYDCSACEQRRTFLEEMSLEDMAEHYPYCPNCGAKMDGERYGDHESK